MAYGSTFNMPKSNLIYEALEVRFDTDAISPDSYFEFEIFALVECRKIPSETSGELSLDIGC